MQTVLKSWQFHNFTLEEKIFVFKGLEISKIGFQALIVPVPSQIIKTLETVQTFFWDNNNLKLKHKTIWKNCREGGLKTVDIRNKLTSVQISWVKRL